MRARIRGFSEKSECSFAGVEPTTFRLLVRMLYHWAMGDSRELGLGEFRKNPSVPSYESNLRPSDYWFGCSTTELWEIRES